MTSVSARRPRSPRGWRLRGVVVLVALAGVWSAGWFAAARLADSGFDQWLSAESRAGRQWTCPERRTDGYPFALHLRCTRPTFRGEIAGHTADGVLEGLRAGVAVGHPTTLAVAVSGPLNLRAEDDSFELELSWADLHVEVPGLPREPRGGRIATSRLAVSLSTREAGDFNMRAAALSGEAELGAGVRSDARFIFAASGVTLPMEDPIPGLSGPIAASGGGVLTQAGLLQAPTVARLEAWRQAGGSLHLDQLSVAQGTFTGTAAGELALDDLHRPAGHLDASVAGFEPVARRFGLPLTGVQLGGLLSTLLSGGKAPKPTQPGAVQLPLILADGRLSVGPFQTGVALPPLY